MDRVQGRIALIEDDADVRPVLTRILHSEGYDPEVFASGDEFLKGRKPRFFDVVVTDFQMEGSSGLDVLKACRAEEDSPEVLLITGFASVRNAVEAMRMGAFDYLAKPVDPKELLHRIGQALEARRLKHAVDALSGEVRRRQGIAQPIGESAVMRELLATARKAAASSATVLILGETGTGKDVIARYIQSTGPRAQRTYLTINCAALPENLLESELFGHARGAFSGAHALKRGLFEEANGGTLFLDEIGSMTMPAQAKLLQVLEQSSVRRVGENHPIQIDVRILAATNRDLKAAIRDGEFRDDLFYRLSVVTLYVPPLRERKEDIGALARHFLAEAVRRIGKMRVLSPETLEFFGEYSFPGNIRQLRYAIEQAVLLSEDALLVPSDFASLRAPIESAPAGGSSRARTREHPIGEEVTPQRLREVLERCGGSRVKAARALQISRATLYRLLERESGTKPDVESG